MKEYKGYFILFDAVQKHTIKSKGAGILPAFLKGRFTSTNLAMQAIDSYLNKKSKKTVKKS